MGNIKVLQIVGYKNSGKTTLLTNWIERAKEAGKKVTVLKSHGHGGPLDMPPEQTDSMKYFNSGADSSAVVSEDLIQWHIQLSERNIEQLIRMMGITSPDFILVEGFKEAHYDKVVLIRSEEDWETLKKLERVRCIITHESVQIHSDLPQFSYDHDEVERWFYKWMEE